MCSIIQYLSEVKLGVSLPTSAITLYSLHTYEVYLVQSCDITR